MSPAIWPIIVALILWLVAKFTGNDTHLIDGILFWGAVGATLLIILWNERRKKTLNDKAPR